MVVWPALNAFISGETVGAKHEGKNLVLLHDYGERFLTLASSRGTEIDTLRAASSNFL